MALWESQTLLFLHFAFLPHGFCILPSRESNIICASLPPSRNLCTSAPSEESAADSFDPSSIDLFVSVFGAGGIIDIAPPPKRSSRRKCWNRSNFPVHLGIHFWLVFAFSWTNNPTRGKSQRPLSDGGEWLIVDCTAWWQEVKEGRRGQIEPLGRSPRCVLHFESLRTLRCQIADCPVNSMVVGSVLSR